MKIGDKLYCYNYPLMSNMIIGETYKLKNVIPNDMLVFVISDVNEWFYYGEKDVDHLRYYKKYFYTEQEYRKIKLREIERNILTEYIIRNTKSW
jgi:hypothetical protein